MQTHRLTPLQIVALGGLGEIGKNSTAFIYRDQAIIVDAGSKFPSADEPGVDYIVNDYRFLESVKPLGLLLTHGHEDHIGGVPHLLKQYPMPVYGGRLTLAFVRDRLQQHRMARGRKMRLVKSGDRVKIGPFDVSFFAQTHSIPGALGMFIRTPAGNVLVTGDFKFDQEPVTEGTAYHLLAKFMEEGVDLLLSDSTNAEREGFTPSERSVGRKLAEQIRTARSRTIIATFASNVSRVQQIMDIAAEEGKRVLLCGRSMQRVVRIAQETGDLIIRDGVLMDPAEVADVPLERQVVLTTGSQGEPFSGLHRMATGSHPDVTVHPDDTVIIAASTIPGNERAVGEAVDQLMRRGVMVHYDGKIHASGHAAQQELRLMLNLTRPRYFMPVHGEYRMLMQHRALAMATGVPAENIFVLDNGDVLSFHKARGGIVELRLALETVYVSGDRAGSVSAAVMEDRRQLADGGIVVIALTVNERNCLLPGFSVLARGFIERQVDRDIPREMRQEVRSIVGDHVGEPLDFAAIRKALRNRLGDWLRRQTGVRPLVEVMVTRVERERAGILRLERRSRG